MLILPFLRWLLFIAEVLLAVPILYLCILSLSAIICTKKQNSASSSGILLMPVPPATRFAILVPAHNEELVIEHLLSSLAQLAYPADLYTVHVVCDNCTDRTAALVRAAGWVQVHERFDEQRRGKGYALHWLLQQLEERHLFYDAYVIIDADSVVDPGCLQAMAVELANGAQALQARYTVLNPSDSPGTALRSLALTLINHLRPLGRKALGASSTLTGNGMCLTHAILQRYPWQAFSITEDYQYYLTLVQHGERVIYVPQAIVSAQMPLTFADMRTQDIRWESSHPGHSTWRTALSLFQAALRTHDLLRIEALFELLTPPLSFILTCCLLFPILSFFLPSFPDFVLSLLLIGGLACYIGAGLSLLRPSPAVYQAFIHAPGFILWKLWVYLVASRRRKHTSVWVRTNRTLPVKR